MATRKVSKGDHVYLVDGSTYIFRAYHALPPLSRSDGLPVGAVSGFCNMLYKLLLDTQQGDKPSHLAVILDHSGKSFRNEIYPDYKAHRPPAPEDLVPQFPLIRDAVRAFNVACVEMENFEADDLIATYATQCAAKGAKVSIVSSDKDLMQLIGDHVEMLDTMKNRHIGPEQVVEKFGVGPEKVIDVQALAGDSVDNVPGVPGIGVKTAADLINTYGDLDTLLERAEEIKQPKRREKLIENRDMALVSRDLVTLKTDVPLETSADAFAVADLQAEQVLSFLLEMEFSTLTKRIATKLGVEDLSGFTPRTKPKTTAPKDAASGKAKSGANSTSQDVLGPDVMAPIDASAYECVRSLEDLARWIEQARQARLVAVDTETTSLDAMRADLVGLSLCVEPGRACYIPLAHRQGDGLALDGPDDLGTQLAKKDVIEKLKPLFEDPSVLKVGQNIKYDYVILAKEGIWLSPIDDTMLLSYALDAGLHGHGMDALSEAFLGHTPIAFKDITGTGKSQITFDLVPIDKATEYAAEDADITWRLHRLLKPRLTEERRVTVYETLERPLAPVLAQMEMHGIKVDPAVLAKLSNDFATRMAELETSAHEQAGEAFNLGSPKQLGEILFEKMSIPGPKKTKTGAFATGADVLEDLAAQGHELPQTILDWRQLSKLKSTYTDNLIEAIDPKTKRIHTSFSLASTSTGRLSSSDPNLQNIPIRTDEGRQIRTAFVAEKGHRLVSADYSQIELRILAHIADINALKTAFAEGLDIHAMTASEMFGVPIEGMDPMIRRKAKAINFGIIYGISAFGLARQLAIPRGEAQSYIESYFERFPGIRAYMDETKAFCRENGYVETLFGRRVHFPEANSKNQAQRAFVDRAAINAPIQGTAADVIRRAMIRMPAAIESAKLTAKMLLQVHDELIFEVPAKEVEKTCKVVRDVMEGACAPALELDVPLIVEAGDGDTWAAAH